jgi:hypothetical protein
MPSATKLSTEARIATAGLCLTVALIHVTDQGGFKELDDPTWLGWGYRALEIGAAIVAVVVLSDLLEPRLTGLAVFGIGAAPFIGYVLTRTVGLPQDSGDIGNWGEPLGIMSLVVEATLMAVALVALVQARASSPVRELSGRIQEAV